jgi:acetyl-CoA C-acetyltransferase
MRWRWPRQQKAAAAQDAGRFKDEIVAVQHRPEEGRPDGVRMPTSSSTARPAPRPGRPAPAFDKAGSVTAGNASGLNDGAAGVVVMTAAKAAALGLKPLARIASYASAGLDPKVMGMGPVPAARSGAAARRLEGPADLDLLEINEAFAAQACAVHKEMGWDTSKVNVNGGAIAIGHPIGASGCRILVTLLHEMQRATPRRASPRCASAAAWAWP